MSMAVQRHSACGMLIGMVRAFAYPHWVWLLDGDLLKPFFSTDSRALVNRLRRSRVGRAGRECCGAGPLLCNGDLLCHCCTQWRGLRQQTL